MTPIKIWAGVNMFGNKWSEIDDLDTPIKALDKEIYVRNDIVEELIEALERLSAGMAEYDSNPRVLGEQVKNARRALAKARGEA